MTDQEQEVAYEAKRKEIEKAIERQKYTLFEVQLAYAREAKTLADLQNRLRWLHSEDNDDGT